jgi:hypothetical protein
MANDYINWTKVYNVDHQNGLFKLYVSSHTDGNYFGAVLYYVRSGSWSNGDTIRLDMKLEQFRDHSEEGVYQQCIDWINQNLPGKCSIKQMESTEI